MKTLLATLTLFLAGMLAVSAAMAADAAASSSAPTAATGGGACKADAEKLCPGVKPGEGRIKACFKQHKDELSAECKSEIAQAAKKRKGA